MDNVAEDLLLFDFTKVAPSRILVGAKCIPDNVFCREYKLSFRACNCQLKNDILVYSSYAGIKYWQIELDAVNSVTIGTISGLKQRITKYY